MTSELTANALRRRQENSIESESPAPLGIQTWNSFGSAAEVIVREERQNLFNSEAPIKNGLSSNVFITVADGIICVTCRDKEVPRVGVDEVAFLRIENCRSASGQYYQVGVITYASTTENPTSTNPTYKQRRLIVADLLEASKELFKRLNVDLMLVEGIPEAYTLISNQFFRDPTLREPVLPSIYATSTKDQLQTAEGPTWENLSVEALQMKLRTTREFARRDHLELALSQR